MRRKGIIGVVIGVMVAIGVVLWMARDDDQAQTATEPTAATATSGTDTSPSASEDESVSAETSEDPGYVTRLPNYGTAADSTEPHWTELDLPIHFTASNLVSLSQQLIDAALDGSIIAALEFGSARQVCDSVPRTSVAFQAQLQRLLEQAERYRERGTTFPQAGEWQNRPGSAHGSNEEIRAREMAWFEACESLHQFVSNDLRAEVDRLARQGDPGARLLYAMLRPDIRNNPNWLDEIEYWESAAREYTQANLSEKRPEGLIGAGIGHSVEGWRFGVRRFEFPMAYLVAAALCGVEHPVLQGLVANFEQSTSVLAQEDNDRVLRMAADLHQRYCFNSP